MNDGRSETRTTMYPWDVSSDGPSQLDRDASDRRSWSELAKWNDGMWESDRKVKNFEADVSRWVQTFCGFLDLPEYQRDRVTYVLDSIELEDFKHEHLSAEKVILGAISLVVDVEEDPDDLQEWKIEEWIVYDDGFETLMDDVEMSRTELWTARRILHAESEYFDL